MKLAPILLLLMGMVGCASSASRAPAPPMPAPPPAPRPPASPAPPSSARGTDAKPGETGDATGSGDAGQADDGDGDADGTGAQAPRSESESESESETEGTPGGATTGEEKRAGLDEDLDQSLRDFDAILMREQEALEERHEATATASARTGSRAGRSPELGAEDGRGDPELDGTGGSPDAAPRDENDETTEPPEIDGSVDDRGSAPVPADVGDGAGDDIVARQLREAAMNEEDPELREKLWDEYRAYKAGARQ